MGNAGLLQLSQQAIVLMGISFIIGSLFTIFVLLILEMMRAGRLEHLELLEQQREQQERARDGAERDAA